MDDDLNDKINQVAEMIKNDELPDNIKNIISMLSKDTQSDSTDSDSAASPSAYSEKSGTGKKKSSNNDHSDDDMVENLAMISKIKKILDKTTGAPDPKLSLLSALEPFLNDSRQDKLKNCMKIVKMTKLTEILKETDLF